ncbi:hypothetical protein [Nitrosomonas communis]|uniref:hypothetical protein n=1 Tax=Nitrosomonas communis TaxID=44574 RepID=UPI0011154212|nr:hypothetical protein [Nitrosomonas communis]
MLALTGNSFACTKTSLPLVTRAITIEVEMGLEVEDVIAEADGSTPKGTSGRALRQRVAEHTFCWLNHSRRFRLFNVN